MDRVFVCKACCAGTWCRGRAGAGAGACAGAGEVRVQVQVQVRVQVQVWVQVQVQVRVQVNTLTAARSPTPTRLTRCWNAAYEFKYGSNVVCTPGSGGFAHAFEKGCFLRVLWPN